MITEQQKFMIEKVREDELILFRDEMLGRLVFGMAKDGKTTDEILVWLWDNQYGEKYGLMPQAVNNFLTKKGLTQEIRKAIRNTPILAKVNEGLMHHVDNKNLKALMFIKEHIDPEYKKQTEAANVTNIGKQITQINIQVVKPEDEEPLTITPEA